MIINKHNLLLFSHHIHNKPKELSEEDASKRREYLLSPFLPSLPLSLSPYLPSLLRSKLSLVDLPELPFARPSAEPPHDNYLPCLVFWPCLVPSLLETPWIFLTRYNFNRPNQNTIQNLSVNLISHSYLDFHRGGFHLRRL